MKLLIGIFLLNGSFALANTPSYDLSMNLSLNGKYASSPRLIVKEGEAGTIIQKTKTEHNFIEVVATEKIDQNHKGILMKFVVGTIDKNGQRKIIAKPQIVARENETAQITVSTDNGPEELSLSVIAKRKEL